MPPADQGTSAFHEDVAALLEEGRSLLEMQVMRRRDHRDVDLAVENLAPDLGGEGEAEFLTDELQLRRSEPADAVELHFRASDEDGDMDAIGEVAGADNRGAELGR